MLPVFRASQRRAPQGPGAGSETDTPAQTPGKQPDSPAGIEAAAGTQAAWPGPEGYGYVGSTVAYDWAELSATGTAVTTLSDDGYAGPFPIGFTFPFHDSLYSEFYAAAAGLRIYATANLTSPAREIPAPGRCWVPR